MQHYISAKDETSHKQAAMVVMLNREQELFKLGSAKFTSEHILVTFWETEVVVLLKILKIYCLHHDFPFPQIQLNFCLKTDHHYSRPYCISIESIAKIGYPEQSSIQCVFTSPQDIADKACMALCCILMVHICVASVSCHGTSYDICVMSWPKLLQHLWSHTLNLCSIGLWCHGPSL